MAHPPWLSAVTQLLTATPVCTPDLSSEKRLHGWKRHAASAIPAHGFL